MFDVGLGYGEVEIDSAIANRDGEPGGASANFAGLSRKSLVLRGQSGVGAAPSDGAALRRARRGRRGDGGARRSSASGPGAAPPARSQGGAGAAPLPQG